MLRFLPGPGEKTASPLSDQAISSTRSGTQEAGDRGAVEWKTGGGGGGTRPVGSVRCV